MRKSLILFVLPLAVLLMSACGSIDEVLNPPLVMNDAACDVVITGVVSIPEQDVEIPLENTLKATVIFEKGFVGYIAWTADTAEFRMWLDEASSTADAIIDGMDFNWIYKHYSNHTRTDVDGSYRKVVLGDLFSYENDISAQVEDIMAFSENEISYKEAMCQVVQADFSHVDIYYSSTVTHE